MRFLLATALSFFLVSRLIAQDAGLDVKGMLQGLQDIKQKQSVAAQSQFTQTINDFTAASADDGSALNFYIEGIRQTQFVGRDQEDAAFADWQKNEVPRLIPPAIHAALRYTTISLQRAAGATDAQIFPILYAYAQETEAMMPAIDAQIAQEQQAMALAGEGRRERDRAEWQNQQRPGGTPGTQGPQRPMGPINMTFYEPVSENLFSRWYNIGTQLGALQDWEQVPANIDNMYTEFLLPYMRKTRDARILQYWDNKIVTERNAAAGATAAFNTDRFNLTRRPALLWSRAEDEIVIGMRDQGITEMYGLVKGFPGHPDAGKWITELEGLLTTPPAVATGGTTPAATQ
jgi:hypothetical protein